MSGILLGVLFVQDGVTISREQDVLGVSAVDSINE